MREEALAVRQLLASLGEAADDEEAREIVASAESSLPEAVTAALDDVARIEALIEGIGQRQLDLAARKARLAGRRERIRDAIVEALVTAGLMRLELPEGLVTVARGRPGLVVTDEASVPAPFWRVEEKRSLMRESLRQALAAGAAVPGAELSNAAPVLQVRVA